MRVKPRVPACWCTQEMAPEFHHLRRNKANFMFRVFYHNKDKLERQTEEVLYF